MTTTAVVNKRKSDYDIYIGRGSIWGNPFWPDNRPYTGDHKVTLVPDAEVLPRYEQWVRDRPSLMEKLRTLKGKRLGCYCKPKPCHGDVLVKLIEETCP